MKEPFRLTSRKYIAAAMAIIIFAWISFTQSPFQKGGIHPDFRLVIELFIFSIALLISYFYKFTFFERLLVVVLAALINFFLISALVEKIIEALYHGKTWVLWQTKYKIFANLIYYGFSTIFLIIFIKGYVWLKQKRSLP